ncbi:hypothetical protein F4808DRAFT_417139 [Astrocystis sublimbata]|nr:hypothetical protein F4808DRAFT_417139 [Astrocystis sublimbata]
MLFVCNGYVVGFALPSACVTWRCLQCIFLPNGSGVTQAMPLYSAYNWTYYLAIVEIGIDWSRLVDKFMIIAASVRSRTTAT